MSIVVVNTAESTSKVSNIDEKCVQQLACDLRLENVWCMTGTFTIDEDGKTPRMTMMVLPDSEGYYHLYVGSYEVSFDHDIAIGPDEGSLVVTRSTLVRNGVQLTSGMWDPGFQGRGGCCMHISGGPMKIKKGTRIGQFVTWKVLNSQGQYDGSYGLDADGKPKDLEVKYHK